MNLDDGEHVREGALVELVEHPAPTSYGEAFGFVGVRVLDDAYVGQACRRHPTEKWAGACLSVDSLHPLTPAARDLLEAFAKSDAKRGGR